MRLASLLIDPHLIQTDITWLVCDNDASSTTFDALKTFNFGVFNRFGGLLNTPLHFSPFTTAISVYVVGLILLTAYEEFAVPFLKLNSILPDVPLLPGSFTEKEKAVQWITPWTADFVVPPPVFEDLKALTKYRIGRQGDITQFITARKLQTIVPGVKEVSPEWTAFYNSSEIYIFKQRVL